MEKMKLLSNLMGHKLMFTTISTYNEEITSDPYYEGINEVTVYRPSRAYVTLNLSLELDNVESTSVFVVRAGIDYSTKGIISFNEVAISESLPSSDATNELSLLHPNSIEIIGTSLLNKPPGYDPIDRKYPFNMFTLNTVEDSIRALMYSFLEYGDIRNHMKDLIHKVLTNKYCSMGDNVHYIKIDHGEISDDLILEGT